MMIKVGTEVKNVCDSIPVTAVWARGVVTSSGTETIRVVCVERVTGNETETCRF